MVISSQWWFGINLSKLNNLIEAVLLSFSSILSFYLSTKALEYNLEAFPFTLKANSITQQLTDSGLSNSEKLALQASLKENLDEQERIIKLFYDTINLSILVRII